MYFLLLLAQNTTQQPPATQPESPWGGIWTFAPALALIAVAYYFLMVLPGRRQEKERQGMMSTLKKNDRVLTAGGIYGIVAGVKDKEDEVQLKIDENSPVRLRVTKGSIIKIFNAEDASKETKDGKDGKERKEG